MKDMFPIRLLWICGLVVIAAGAIATVVSARQAGVVSARLNRKSLEIRELQKIENEFRRIDAAKQAFENLESKQPISPEKLIKESLSDYLCDEIRESRQDGQDVDGWILHRKEIIFGDIPLGKLAEFIRNAESCRPPWRLMKCVIQSGRTPGTGKAAVVMEGLEKAENR